MRSHLKNIKLDELERTCRGKHAPLTVQRRMVLQLLASRTDHPTADQLFAEVHREAPQVSRTTVYRVLDKLLALGLVRRISSADSRSRFDADTAPHHHLQCVSCGAVADFHDPALDAIRTPTVAETGFEIIDYEVNFNGICPVCRSAAVPSRDAEAGQDQEKEIV